MDSVWLCHSIFDYITIPYQCILYKFTNTIQLYAIHIYRDLQGQPFSVVPAIIVQNLCTQCSGQTVLSDTLRSSGHRRRRKL